MARVGALILVLVAGCRGARDDYSDFLARRQSDGGAAQTVQSSLQDLSGRWLLRALLAGGLDLGLRVEIAMDLPTRAMHARLWLAAADPDLDAPIVETDTTVEPDGTFVLNVDPLVLQKGSTPGLNVDVTASVVLNASTQNPTAWCGTALGRVSKPLALDLAGSTFAARPDSRTLDLADVPQSCFPRTMGGGGPITIPKPASPDLSSVTSMTADLSGSWILTANLAGSLPLQLWAELIFTPAAAGGGSLDGALRRATDPPGSIALTTFSTLVSPEGRFEIWLPALQVGSTEASVLLVAATRGADVFCGAGAGQVHKPLELDLTNTTFGAARWTPGTPVPASTANACQ